MKPGGPEKQVELEALQHTLDGDICLGEIAEADNGGHKDEVEEELVFELAVVFVKEVVP